MQESDATRGSTRPSGPADPVRHPRGAMKVKGGKLEFLVPHYLRGQLLRPGFVRASLKLGAARQMPAWAKLQFLNAGVSREDLDLVLGRITSLGTWVDEWEKLGEQHETGADAALASGDRAQAAQRYLAASAAYNFAQYVMFIDIGRKRGLHEACIRAYSKAAPLFHPPARPLEVVYRRRPMLGWLRVPRRDHPAPVVVMINGTNAVKEELHWWAEAFLERGLAVATFDGPGLGQTFHRLSMVAEPRPVGSAILDHLESRPDVDAGATAFVGMSLGGYMAIRMASHDPRIRAVAAVSPPYSASIYWDVTLAALRRELAALYGIAEREMGATIERITLADVLDRVRCPLFLSSGGHDHITPPDEARRIFEEALCERDLAYYPFGAHDCFNVLSDLRPRVVGWVAGQLERHHARRREQGLHAEVASGTWSPAEAVDEDFAEELQGDAPPRQWHRAPYGSAPARWRWWIPRDEERVVVEMRHADGTLRPEPRLAPRERARLVPGDALPGDAIP
jgi:2,6-dihydroxypseudooxynicotine hydrolase